MTRRPTRDRDREAEILDAALAVLADQGIGGVSMRAVARQADVALGLANYYFTDKRSLICAALRRIGERDLEILRPATDLDPVDRLRLALHGVADDALLDRHYLASRLQLWALAAVDGVFADINNAAQRSYAEELAMLIEAAVPELAPVEAARRAGEILVIQNGIWLTAAIVDDVPAVASSIDRCEQIAFAPPPARSHPTPGPVSNRRSR